MNKKARTRAWYEDRGMLLLNEFLVQCAAHGIPHAYLDNLEVIPSDIDRKELVRILKRDGLLAAFDDGWIKALLGGSDV